MPYENRVSLPGSKREPLRGATRVKPVQTDETISVTVVLRRRHAEPFVAAVPTQRKFSSREEFRVIHGADPADLNALDRFAHEHGLTVAGCHRGSRSVILSGTAEAIQSAFSVDLGVYENNGISYRGRVGNITIPSELAPSIVAVLGLDDRPVAKPHSRGVRPHAAASSFTPPKLAELYNFPTGVTGTGQTIGIIELGGGYRANDLATYFKGLDLKTPVISAVSIDNGKNHPGTDADGEVMLDIEVASAVANGAKIVVYFAPNTDQGFHDAIAAAVHDKVHQPSVISISWGGPENTWTQQALDAMNSAFEDAAALGVTITVAAGDDGATDGSQDGSLQVDFPSSSPYVLSCGGTKVAAESGTISSEQVWNELANQEGATGGGVSRIFALPQDQSGSGVPAHPDTNFVGRGVPDVSGDADPVTGYSVRVDGQDTVIGGTSAVAPLWAGLIALLNQQAGHPLGFVNPLLYQIGESAFRNIVTGDNGHYHAGATWDACTGLGSPDGKALSAALTTALGGGAAAAATAS